MNKLGIEAWMHEIELKKKSQMGEEWREWEKNN